MYGKLANAESGGIHCVLSIFDRAKGRTALESMPGSRIGLGSTLITNKIKKGNCRVLVDC